MVKSEGADRTATYQVRVLDRAVDILETFPARRKDLSIREIVDAIQVSERGDAFWREYGTAGIGASSAYVEDAFPIRNWQWCSWSDPAVRGMTGPFMSAASFVRKQACPGCILHCLYPVEITSSDELMNGHASDMPDWEAMGMVGGNLGYFEMEGATPEDTFAGSYADQAEHLAKLQFTTYLHDDYGLDYIEGGALLYLLLLIWVQLVYGHVLRHALNLSLVAGVGLAIGYTFTSAVLIELLFPLPAT